MSEGHGKADPSETVRLQLIHRVFDEALKDHPNGPIRSEIENLRAEAMAPGSKWGRPPEINGVQMSLYDYLKFVWRRSLP
jgi:hypothetical protein